MLDVAERERIEGRVGEIMPRGKAFDLPEAWRARYAGLDVRKESPSSIVRFLGCQLQWFTERHSGMPPEDEVKPAPLMGTFVHRVLEVFYSEPPHLRTEDLLFDTFEAAWEELVKGDGSDGIIPPELMRDFERLQEQAGNADARDAQRGRLYRLAQECLDSVYAFDGDPAELEVLSNEGWIRGEHGSVRINGRIDRTVKGRGATEIIQDYKTGKTPKIKDGFVDPLSPTFIPAGLYAWMRTRAQESEGADAEFAPLRVRSIQLLYLAHMKRYTLNVTEELLYTMDTLVKEVVAAMDEVAQTGKVKASPASGPTDAPCRWCPIVDACPVWSTARTDEDAIDELEQFVKDKIDQKKARAKGR